MEEVKEVMIVVEHGAVKGWCVEWFSGRVQRLDFGSAESTRILKGGFKMHELFNQVRKGSRRDFHRNRRSFVGSGISHGSIGGITDGIHFRCRNSGDCGIEKIIIQRFCFLSEKAIKCVDGGQESKGLSVEFMN